MRFIQDERGFPVMLVDAVASKDLLEPSSPPPASPSSDEQARRSDAVREAAREIEDLTVQDLKERLKGVTNRALADHELAQFEADVRAQVLHDRVDVLHQSEVGKLRARRTLRLQASRGYVRKKLHSRTDGELRQLAARLRARGWSQDQIAHGLGSRLSAARMDSLAGKL